MECHWAPAHHVAVKYARKDVYFHVPHAGRYAAIGVQHLDRRPVVAIAPNYADEFTDAIDFLD